ncbi:MAG TPA: DUF6588 family protein [Bacteroidales bacterium]|nr:DUF6588 family protein [Bacteroidales bacterium]
MLSRLLRGTIATFLVIFLIGSQNINAQIDDIVDGKFLQGGVDDGLLLMENYLAPYVNAFGAGFNSAWYNTAKPHKLGGFDITLSVSAAFVPDGAREFDLADLNFQNLTLVDPGSSITPTVAGVKDPGPALHLVENVPGYGDLELINFNSPPGTGFGIIPAPMLQAGIGMPLGSEIKIRYIPKIPISEGFVSLIGGGLMHSVSQYFKGFELLPVNISAFGGWSKLAASIPINVIPDSYDDYSLYTSVDFEDQFFNIDVSSWNTSLIASVDVPLVSAYAGIGYGRTITIFDIEGNIPLPGGSITGPAYFDIGVVENIPEVKIKNFSGLRVNIGGRLKLGVITIHAGYTRAKYNVVTGGMGISFR